MKTVLYADVLFIINFGMDLITIWLSFLIVHESTSTLRLIISSVIGGLYGVITVVFDFNGILSVTASILISLIMVLISSRSRLTFGKYVKYTFILWGVGALLGGVTSLIVRFGKGNENTFKTHNAPFFVLALAGLISSLIIKAFSSRSAVESCIAKISIFGSSVETKMLTDSGNLVKEPISGAPVIFVKKKLFDAQLVDHIDLFCGKLSDVVHLPPDLKRRLRLVKVERAGDSAVLPAFIPDEVELRYKKQHKKVSCVIVFENIDDYAGFDGIVPAVLLK